MRLGVILPQTEIGADVGAVRTYVTEVARLGFEHLSAPEHVVGADPRVHPGWNAPFDVSTTFHEPFVLFGYIAALTPLELVTGVVVLPQRQTVLAAKQAVELDLMTNGRFRLGVGVGWNAVEYEALGMPFSRRGARIEEQVVLMRKLWSQRSVTNHSMYEQVTGAGLSPRPIQQPIPIWFGAGSAPAYRRIGRLGDGWFPRMPPGAELDAAKSIIEDSARQAGRDPASIGMEGRVTWTPAGVDKVVEDIRDWRYVGASHVSLNTMGAGFACVDDHIAALVEVAAALNL